MKGHPWDLGLVGAAPLPAPDPYCMSWFPAEYESQEIIGGSSDPFRCCSVLAVESERIFDAAVAAHNLSVTFLGVWNVAVSHKGSRPLAMPSTMSIDLKGAGFSFTNRPSGYESTA